VAELAATVIDTRNATRSVRQYGEKVVKL
jgi:hypothetical protein